MKIALIALAAASALALTAAAKPGVAATATANVIAADGTAHGTVTATQTTTGLDVVYTGTGLTPGEHGVHVHTTGKCDAPDFTTAGGHWNPTGKMHGSMNPHGPHAGDLPNLTVAEDGTGTIRFTIPGATLSGGAEAMLDADGAAFVVHAGPDDLKSDPAGNSGGRIACGTFSAG
ncbi:superoxide dismutase family protein [Sphingomonas flavalba]|uniref:superoxide dismutase family protein n=1 Tax=Sphingomonas flavalba TaxID=2559804 RepID=UPI0039E162B3